MERCLRHAGCPFKSEGKKTARDADVVCAFCEIEVKPLHRTRRQATLTSFELFCEIEVKPLEPLEDRFFASRDRALCEIEVKPLHHTRRQATLTSFELLQNRSEAT